MAELDSCGIYGCSCWPSAVRSLLRRGNTVLTLQQWLGNPQGHLILLQLPHRRSYSTPRSTAGRSCKDNRQAQGSNEIQFHPGTTREIRRRTAQTKAKERNYRHAENTQGRLKARESKHGTSSYREYHEAGPKPALNPNATACTISTTTSYSFSANKPYYRESFYTRWTSGVCTKRIFSPSTIRECQRSKR